MTLTSDAKFIIGVLVVTIIVIGGGAYITSKKTTPTTSKTVPESLMQNLVREDSPTIGKKDAKVTVVEFGDFQCPACGTLHPVLKEVKKKYADASVRFVFRQFPLPQHENALLAAKASLAAQKQEKFWEYHDALFEHQTNLKADDFITYAKSIGLDVEKFTQDLKASTVADAVQRDRADGNALGVRSTPTLFINDIQYTGKYSVADLSAVIEAELAK
ncbi:MAG: hypothetical protein A3C02_01040 [Candidatus Andersenbacteria bacterium RIFCSPHIGHO2_02_FULL_45_11]|uniref:Thioredoxin domain-containing protein n=1 Tax=Candidatus Andersenbacteria bacterium RIFCSPHIGHO2_12_FULL_45_11 TaxID=1797281 RepID=A0A1G1X1A1_9BACT|nr:MAG: hypothetical protein A2805_00465 [Candidatus Andersenbacteria bacterium RIFCSPHIGHO2_01_FULL_46_36]OGY33137.1 MAG: hypothetical protein A3D99_01610 [Candidatus Andersenbacteria bacterium RIFCSPHIGHO2_12_FULL_45_11]OGY33161.1 MAG: hypothetical protein A3C02_01040 [Candidatus Andersenbacteria bacterium RIFCSPHIGHO2_02_FULL_45_11]